MARVEQERKVVGEPAQHHQPRRIFILGSVDGNNNEDASRIDDKRRWDGAKKHAGWVITAFRRLDRDQVDFHRGRRFDGKRGRGHAELRGRDAIDIDCNG